jgi:ABC-type multidrug transport system permease subunit
MKPKEKKKYGYSLMHLFLFAIICSLYGFVAANCLTLMFSPFLFFFGIILMPYVTFN